ncbi:MAG: YbaB/EbfC family nucleoid-associated protein [Firmicutes bacterium]|nr:YbaB/EbfC family nucleoid-associated protein [Bacillota bacterium]
MNMNKMLKQAQKMQKKMIAMQKELEEKTVESTSGGGAVRAVANGRKELVTLEIAPEVVEGDDLEMLQDLIISAVNGALRRAEEMISEEMKKATGGFNLPPGFF